MQANIERLEIFSQAVHVLIDNQLRPGADASRTDAELAATRNQWIHAARNRRAVIGGLLASTSAVLFVLPLLFAITQRQTKAASLSLPPDDNANLRDTEEL